MDTIYCQARKNARARNEVDARNTRVPAMDARMITVCNPFLGLSLLHSTDGDRG